MIKSYGEMRKIDVKPFCENRDGVLYLNWAMCTELLHENGAEVVYWEPIPNEKTGNSLRPSEISFSDSKGISNRCYETRIKVVIDDSEYEMQTPVLNGMNPVKDNSMSQLRVWNSMCRAFVKCVAIRTGLGFDLWLKEEYNNVLSNIPFTVGNVVSASKIKTIKTLCSSHGIDADAWVCGNNKNWETLTEGEAAKMLNALKERYGDE